jgi:hypothetical protein
MKRVILFIVFLFVFQTSKSQSNLFLKSFDVETQSNFQQSSKMIETYDRAYVLAFTSKDTLLNQSTIELIKIDSNGHYKWHHNFLIPDGGSYVQLAQSSESGFIVSSTFMYIIDNTAKIGIIKTDKNGKRKWVRFYGDSTLSAVNQDLIIHSNQIYSMAYGSIKIGSNQYERDYFVLKTDTGGNTIWFKKFNWNYAPFPKTMVFDNANNFYVSAEILDHMGNPQFALQKIDISGNIVWSKIYTPQFEVDPLNMIFEPSGNLILTGRTGAINPSGWDIFLMKIDTNGNFIWAKTFGNGMTDNLNDEGYFVFKNKSGYMICAEPESFGNVSRASLIQTDTLGNIQWMKLYGDSTGSFPNGALQLNSGYVIYGIKGSYGVKAPIYLMKTDMNGVTSCKWQSVTLPSYSFTLTPSDTGISGNVNGSMTYNFTEQIKSLTEFDECEHSSIVYFPSSKNQVELFPNPFTSEIKLNIGGNNFSEGNLRVENILGQIVYSMKLQKTPETIDLSILPKGMYFAEILIGNQVITKKIVKQ